MIMKIVVKMMIGGIFLIQLITISQEKTAQLIEEKNFAGQSIGNEYSYNAIRFHYKSSNTQKDISQLYNALTYLDFRDPHGGDLTDYDTWTTPPPGTKR